MRRIALAVVLLAVALCLLASGTERGVVRVYFTVATFGGQGATQLWRCNRDGSDPELLYTGFFLGGLTIDSAAEKLFFVENPYLYAADLDGSSVTVFGPAAWAPDVSWQASYSPVDGNGGYVCWVDLGWYVFTAKADGSDLQEFSTLDIPGIVEFPGVVGLAIHVEPSSPVQSTTWGGIKAEFR